MQLVCPASSLPALKSTLRQNVDAIYVGSRDDTNARHFVSLSLDKCQLQEGPRRIHEAGQQFYIAVNTYSSTQGWEHWQRAVDQATDFDADASIAANVAVLGHTAKCYPRLSLHLSAQGSATDAAALTPYHERYGTRRTVLPRVLSLVQVCQVTVSSPVPVEVFASGSLCIMAKGRCHLSSYITNELLNLCGVCSPARAVHQSEKPEGLISRLNEVFISHYAVGEAADYPTLYKGRFPVNGQCSHTLEEPISLNILDLVP